jgi:hypothetical protein
MWDDQSTAIGVRLGLRFLTGLLVADLDRELTAFQAFLNICQKLFRV